MKCYLVICCIYVVIYMHPIELKSLGGWGLGLGPYDPLNPLHGGVSAHDAAGVGGAEGMG